MTNADDADDLAPAQAESLQHNLEQTEKSIGLHVNADKTVHMF